MLLKQPLHCCFYLEKKKQACSAYMSLKSRSSSGCLFSPFYCKWDWCCSEVQRGDTRAVLATTTASVFMFPLGAFHWHRTLSDWQTSILSVESFVKGLSMTRFTFCSHSEIIHEKIQCRKSKMKCRWPWLNSTWCTQINILDWTVGTLSGSHSAKWQVYLQPKRAIKSLSPITR